MLLTCFTVSGKRRLRTITVSKTIASHHGAPRFWWKYSRTVPRMFTMGPKSVWKKSAMLLIIRSYSSYGVESSLGERVTTEHPEDARIYAPRYAVPLYGLQRVQGATRGESAGRWEHGGEVGAVQSYQPYARPSQGYGPPSSRPAPGRADLAQRLAELCPELLEASIGRRLPRRHYEVEVAGDFGDAGVEYLPEPPPHRVPRHRIADLAGDGEAQSRGAMLVGESVHGEEPAPVSSTLTIDPLELWRVSQPHAFASRQRSDCQALASPAPTVGDNSASSHRTHALAEAVRLGSLATIGLISALHRTPLQVLRSLQTTHESISEASNAIQQSEGQFRLREREAHRSASEKNAAKQHLKHVRTRSAHPFPGPEARPHGLDPYPREYVSL